jgi:ATP synthase protein I
MKQNNEIEDLQKRIEKIKSSDKKKDFTKESSNYSLAMTVATELVAGIIIGMVIGVFFDKVFDSKPLFIILCLLLGIVASLRTIWKKMSSKDGA